MKLRHYPLVVVWRRIVRHHFMGRLSVHPLACLCAITSRSSTASVSPTCRKHEVCAWTGEKQTR